MSKGNHQHHKQGHQGQHQPSLVEAQNAGANAAAGSAADEGEAKDSGKGAPEATSEYHVAGPGSAYIDGRMVPPGEVVQLTAGAAKALGEAVRPGRPPVVDYTARDAGSYVVVGPGSVCSNGKFHGPGSVIQLSADDARRFGDLVKPARG